MADAIRLFENTIASLTLDRVLTSESFSACQDWTLLMSSDDDDGFNENMVQDLTKRLQGPVEIQLTAHDKALLAIIVEGTYQVEQQRRALDLCGLRYLISVELLASHFRRHEPNGSSTNRAPHQHRLSFRNIVWASHSESQDMLLNASTNYCSNKKMMWDDAKALGVFLWLKSTEVIVRHHADVPRDEDG
jgi:hypothetical protein